MRSSVFFSELEMVCKCGCGFIIKNKTLIRQLTIARLIFNRLMLVSSWCRCPKKNDEEGGATNSYHLSGEAVDISCIGNDYRHQMLNAFLKAGFNRIGLGPNYIHIDVGLQGRSNIIWLDF